MLRRIDPATIRRMEPIPHLVAPGVDYRAMVPSPTSPKIGEAITADRDSDGIKYLLLGCPYDAGIPSRPGARFGPDAIRTQLAKLGTWTGQGELKVDEKLILDLGNIEALQTAPLGTLGRLEAALSQALTDHRGAFPVVLGGDHSLTAAAFTAVQRAHGGQLGCLVFDAHYDVREWDPEHLSSGTPFRRILELGTNAIVGRNLVYVGIRPFANSPYYQRWVFEQGAWSFYVHEVRARGMAGIIDEAMDLATQGTDGVYCSLDIDAIDQGDAPGASATGPGGLRADELLMAMEMLGKGGSLVALDVMETSPPLDFQDMTSRLAAHAIATFIAAREGAFGDS